MRHFVQYKIMVALDKFFWFCGLEEFSLWACVRAVQLKKQWLNRGSTPALDGRDDETWWKDHVG